MFVSTTSAANTKPAADPVETTSYKQLEEKHADSLIAVTLEPPRYHDAVAGGDEPTYDKLTDRIPLTLETMPLSTSTGEYDKLETVSDDEKIDLGSQKNN